MNSYIRLLPIPQSNGYNLQNNQLKESRNAVLARIKDVIITELILIRNKVLEHFWSPQVLNTE